MCSESQTLMNDTDGILSVFSKFLTRIGNKSVQRMLNVVNYILFIPRTVGDCTTINQQNAQCSSLDIYIILQHSEFLHVSIHKPSKSGKKHEIKLH